MTEALKHFQDDKTDENMEKLLKNISKLNPDGDDNEKWLEQFIKKSSPLRATKKEAEEEEDEHVEEEESAPAGEKEEDKTYILDITNENLEYFVKSSHLRG